MGRFKEVMPVVFRDTSFSFGPSLDASITKAVPGASSRGGRDDGPNSQRKWAGLSGQYERSLVTLCGNCNPYFPQGLRRLRLLPP